MTQRDLSDGESTILNLIQFHYGPLNTREEVKIHGNDEAVCWAKDSNGDAVIMINLTTLAQWLADGTISSEAELLRDWLNVDGR